MTNIARRVSRLEDVAGVRDQPPPVWISIRAEPNETDDAAVERYRAEHPDAPDYANFIVHKIVSPQHREVGS